MTPESNGDILKVFLKTWSRHAMFHPWAEAANLLRFAFNI
jgi:hypothetical protein